MANRDYRERDSHIDYFREDWVDPGGRIYRTHIASVGTLNALTGELSVRYRRPCPVEKPLELSAWRTETQAHYFVIVAEARDNGELLAQSTGKFFFDQR